MEVDRRAEAANRSKTKMDVAADGWRYQVVGLRFRAWFTPY